MENPRTKAKCARKQRKEKEEVPAATATGHPTPPSRRGPERDGRQAILQRPRRTGHLAPAQKSGARHPESRRIGHSSPDTRPPTWTSGTCLCAENGPRAHVSPSHLPLHGIALYILPHLLLVRVSKGLAHLRQSFAHPYGSPPRERPRPLWRRSTMDSRPLYGKIPRGFKASSQR